MNSVQKLYPIFLEQRSMNVIKKVKQDNYNIIINDKKIYMQIQDNKIQENLSKMELIDKRTKLYWKNWIVRKRKNFEILKNITESSYLDGSKYIEVKNWGDPPSLMGMRNRSSGKYHKKLKIYNKISQPNKIEINYLSEISKLLNEKDKTKKWIIKDSLEFNKDILEIIFVYI